jgi:hypothetical protein
MCFIRLLQVFHLDVAYVCNGFEVFSSRVFASVSDACFKYFIDFVCCLHLDVSKVDQTLHMGCVWEAAGDASDVRGGIGLLLGRCQRYGPRVPSPAIYLAHR